MSHHTMRAPKTSSTVSVFAYFNIRLLTNIEAVLAVMNITELVVEIWPENNSGPYGIWTHGRR